MIEHIGQTEKIDKLVNEIINEEREDAFFEGACSLLEDVFGLTVITAKDYNELIEIGKINLEAIIKNE